MNNFDQKIRYLCLLGHKLHPTQHGYWHWQQKIIKKYHLWSFSYITLEQIELEIQIKERQMKVIHKMKLDFMKDIMKLAEDSTSLDDFKHDLGVVIGQVEEDMR